MILAVQGLCKQFAGKDKVDAVNDVNFELQKGTFLAIIGRSGSGKSTLLGMIGGISRPTSGQVMLDGCNQWSLDADSHAELRNQKLGFVFQFPSLLPTLRAIDNVALPAIVGGAVNEKIAYARAHALLDRVGLSNRTDAYPGMLSGGEQRRVAIARALINSPEIVLADEPTADLDEETEGDILRLLLDIQKTFDLTLVVVTHNRSIAEQADRLLEMRSGTATLQDVHRSTAEKALAKVVGGAHTDDGAEHARKSEPSESAKSVNELFDISDEQLQKETVRLGLGIERFIGRLVLFTVPMIILVWLSNAGISYYQDSVIDAKIDRQSALEELANKDLRADVKDITFGPGNTYLITLYLRNTTGDEHSIYVMSPTVRAFVQVGTNWQEISLTQVDSATAQVHKITGTQTFQYTIAPDVKGFTELMPYYMHVRISNDMLVSPSSQPKEQLVERNDNYYVYLKPHNADDKAILSKLHFPGNPPVWIPMPPH